MKKRTVKSEIIPALSDYGRRPPQATDLEEVVLGACLLEHKVIDIVMGILQPECFYKEAHQILFKAITFLYMCSRPADQLTLTQQLRTTDELEIVGGPYYLTQLTNRIGSSANIEEHCRIVYEKYMMREMIQICSETIKDAYEDTTDCFELLDNVQERIFSVDKAASKSDFQEIHEIIYKTTKEIEKRAASENKFTGIGSGFTELDRFTNGWQNTDLVILAARPGMGKTAFALSAARNAAVQFGKKVAFFSIEMSKEQLTMRLLAGDTEISHEKLRKGDMGQYDWDQYNEKIGELADSGIYIDDTAALTLMEFVAKARKMKLQHEIDIIFVDYIQLMRIPDMKGNREQEISRISQTIKATAKDLNIPIIALSQLSRKVEERSGKRPQLSDLRESGAIEQDADLVLFLYRPEYYGITEWSDGTSTRGEAEVIISKHRNGSLGDVKMRFVSQFVKFADMDAKMEELNDPDF